MITFNNIEYVTITPSESNHTQRNEMTEEEVKALQEANAKLVERVNQLESINIDLVDQKKELKQKLTDGATDEQLKLELDNYKQKLSEIEEEANSKQATYQAEISKLHMVQMLKSQGVTAHNDDAFNAIAELALDGAEFKDGAFVYPNEDGTTKFNEANEAYSVLDKVNELRSGDKSYFFKQDTGGGGGDTTPPPSKPADDVANYVRDTYGF